MKILSIITPIITLIFFITCCPKNTLICKLDVVYRYIVFLQKEKWYIESFCYNIVENHLYTKFGKNK